MRQWFAIGHAETAPDLALRAGAEPQDRAAIADMIEIDRAAGGFQRVRKVGHSLQGEREREHRGQEPKRDPERLGKRAPRPVEQIANRGEAQRVR